MRVQYPEDGGGVFRSRWQPTWAELLARDCYEEDSPVLRRLVVEDSELDSDEESSDDFSDSNSGPEEDLYSDWPFLPPDESPRGLKARVARSESARWPRKRRSTRKTRTSHSLYDCKMATEYPPKAETVCDLLSEHPRNKPQSNTDIEKTAMTMCSAEDNSVLEGHTELSPPEEPKPSLTHRSRSELEGLSIAEIHAHAKELRHRIEETNASLVELLIERDDLHMAQDAMLLDTEDLSRRAQEIALFMQRSREFDPPPTCVPVAAVTRSALVRNLFAWRAKRRSAPQ